MAKILVYDDEAKQKLRSGVDKLERAVSTTLGPCGRNVIIDEFGSIHSTKDGVTVAKAVTLKDPFENIGANAVKEVAEKSGSRVGDGTTTSTLLAAEIFRNGLKYVSLDGNPTQIKNGISKAASHVVEYIKNRAIKISTEDEVKKVATISANGDTEVGKVIANVMSILGNDGVVKVEDGNGLGITSNIVKGMVIDQSYASPYMVTHPDKQSAEVDNPFILIANKKLSNIQEMVNTLNSVSQTGQPLFIIADDYSDEVLTMLVMNKLRGVLNTIAIKSPSYGDNRKLILEDIATLCGGTVISDEAGIKIENATVQSGILGHASRIVTNKENTVIFGGVGEQSVVESRADNIRSQIESCTSEFDKKQLEERLARLTSGIGIITVGAPTEAERKELRDRVDDAFCAAKAALRSGVVAGGGVALLEAMRDLDVAYSKGSDLERTLIGDETIGVKILRDSLSAPIKKILQNAGVDSNMIVSKLLEHDISSGIGYNALTKQEVNMVEDGIIDPTEVVINEVVNASSISGLLLTTEVLVVEEKSEKSEQMQPMM